MERQLKTILVVDDDNIIRTLTRTALERSGRGFEISLCSSADEALSVLETSAPDLVITDYVMPGMNGVEFISVLGTRTPPVPSILLTGKAEGDLTGETGALGNLAGVIQKPFTPRLLADEVLRLWDVVQQKMP